MKNRCVLASWGSWQEFVWHRKRARKLGYKVFNRMCNSTLVAAWDVWSGEVERQRAEEKAEYDSRHSTEAERAAYLAKMEDAERKKQAMAAGELS